MESFDVVVVGAGSGGPASFAADYAPHQVELHPGSRADLDDYVRRTLVTYHHQVGTCAMRVLGIEGLRVADASIMPAVTSGNTNAPSIMIGERCADLVREEI
ncbi:GMC oxidoreductase [Nonomuraea sp. NPDC046570]|uniref:GMC oxidoreductase n=1 Tax=Nonomuraea sp. NPDC046570 TaxID=3155255 RepID=UPI0033CB9D8D